MVDKKRHLLNSIILLSAEIIVHRVIGYATGLYPWKHSPYNSYVIQANSWLAGRLDVDYYSWLELAEYNGKYFVSFPPFPSYIMFVFACFLGKNVPDGWIAAATFLTGAYYALKLSEHYLGQRQERIFWPVFLFIGTNVVYITMDSSVWFIAQSMALTLTVMAIFYAAKGKAGVSLICWTFSIGCRPFQIIYFPVLALVYFCENKNYICGTDKREIITKAVKYLIPVAVIGLSYMVLNYFRFGSVFEFGHNYLPEFQRAEYGQFSIHYFPGNFSTLFRLPYFESGKLCFYKFNGNCIFIVSPVIVSAILSVFASWNNLDRDDKLVLSVASFCVICHICLLCMHRTMGGYHFGHRYINDTLATIFLMVNISRRKSSNNKIAVADIILFCLGVMVNIYGTILITL